MADVIGDDVGVGEAGLGKREMEEDSSGMLERVLLMILRIKFGRFDGKVSRWGWGRQKAIQVLWLLMMFPPLGW